MLTVCDFRFPVEIFLSIRKPQLSIISVPKRKEKKQRLFVVKCLSCDARLLLLRWHGNVPEKRNHKTMMWLPLRFLCRSAFLPLNALLLGYPHTHTPPRDTYKVYNVMDVYGGAATTTTGLGGGKFERKIRNGSRNVIFVFFVFHSTATVSTYNRGRNERC